MFDQGNYNDQESYPCQCGGNITHSEEYGWLCDACYESPKRKEQMQATEERTKTCPECGKVANNEAEITEHFGWRTINGVKQPQSRCKPCKNGQRKKADDKPKEEQAAPAKPLIDMTEEEITEAVQAADARVEEALAVADKRIAESFGLTPEKTANIVELLWGGRRHEDNSIFSYVLRSHTGIEHIPNFKLQEDFKPRYYEKYGQEEIDEIDEQAVERLKIAEFFYALGDNLIQWCEIDERRRNEIKDQIRAHIAKEKAKEDKKKEKAKKDKAAGKKTKAAPVVCDDCGEELKDGRLGLECPSCEEGDE